MGFLSLLFGKKAEQTKHTEQSLKEIYLQFAQMISHVVFPINKEYIAFLKTESKKIGQKFYETGL